MFKIQRKRANRVDPDEAARFSPALNGYTSFANSNIFISAALRWNSSGPEKGSISVI